MIVSDLSTIASLEPKLRALLPAQLYVGMWVNPENELLLEVVGHLQTLRYLLSDSVPRQVVSNPPLPGKLRYHWEEGTLLFTDLAGFTPLMEANTAQGSEGAKELLTVLSAYFAAMIDVIVKSGGDLLEFTGDALLVQFPRETDNGDVGRAIRAGLRMQRAMTDFAHIQTAQGRLSLAMRVGIHRGRFLAVDLGTPSRMMRVLLGETVQRAKQAEGAGQVGAVCLTEEVVQLQGGVFAVEPGKRGYGLVVDNLSDRRLGEYDITLNRRRRVSSALWFDRSDRALLDKIESLVQELEPLASYLPQAVLKLVVENAAQRAIPPNFSPCVVMFVNLSGLSEFIDQVAPEQEAAVVAQCNYLFSVINGLVTAVGGVMKNPTYHLEGSVLVIYWGGIDTHTDDASRAARVALELREVVEQSWLNQMAQGAIACQIGIAQGVVFAAEVGEPRGRREFNILGDVVNTAARLMTTAQRGQILLTQTLYESLRQQSTTSGQSFRYEFRGAIPLKGKRQPFPVYELQ
ncbi:adenylate/guanylate cyclase domain-containing protein [Spirulina subsalsa FACHB-351]|uniref:Adenylate/guanylate cyclase domain-containing protein n=1 Tax=Spirulina subsalsa FACHB-351 TaxID=234711 RepID=A0ABT3LA49_9CYAN|nr:adenylate/guanylate cyclase domain-containing protein [Spirulina subsalsa]MCW6038381.1 adenylate/guanylate cyclase domain-containing protein [Spirulina subsalsa FACHB-351]